MYIGVYQLSVIVSLSPYQSDNCPINLLHIWWHHNSILLSPRSRLSSFILLPSICDEHFLTALVCSSAFPFGWCRTSLMMRVIDQYKYHHCCKKKRNTVIPAMAKNTSQVGPSTFLLNEYAFGIVVDMTYFKCFIWKRKHWWLNIMDI